MDDFNYGFPPPPSFYTNYSLKCIDPDDSLESKLNSIKDEINEAEGLVFDYKKLKCFQGPLPPVPPNESWYSFGNLEKFHEEEHTLDSETLIRPEPGVVDLREHFRVLYGDFTNSLFTYLDLVKNMNKDSVSEIKKFMKLYINLQYILSNLWKRYCEDEVVGMLKEQLKRRRKFIDSMKIVLFQASNLVKKTA